MTAGLNKKKETYWSLKTNASHQVVKTRYNKVHYFPKLDIEISLFAQELSCQVRADKVLSETFIKQNWYQCIHCQVNTPNKKSNSAKTKIIFASGRCCHGPYHGLFLLQPLKKENIRDDMNLTYLHIYLNNWQAKHQQHSRSLAQKQGNAQKVIWEQEAFCENQDLMVPQPGSSGQLQQIFVHLMLLLTHKSLSPKRFETPHSSKVLQHYSVRYSPT